MDVTHQITLNSAANTSDDAFAVRTMATVASSLNLLGGYFWDKLHGDNPSHHTELGIYGVVLISSTSRDSDLISFIFVFIT